MSKVNTVRSPGENLQMIIDRYTKVGTSGGPALNGPFGARQGRLYPELTSYGLVAVKADKELSRLVFAQVLIIGDNFITTALHSLNRDTGLADERTGYKTLALSEDAEGFHFGPSQDELNMLAPGERKNLQDIEVNVSMILGQFAVLGSAYDALHEIHASRYPSAPQGQEATYPNAGLQYGPRINFEDMLRSDSHTFHPAVLEAALNMPPLKSD